MEGSSEKQLEIPPPYTPQPVTGQQQGPPGPPVYNTYPAVQQPTIIIQGALPLDRNPTSMICPRCQANIVTEIRLKAGSRAWGIFAIFCLLGCWCGCCLIPFYKDSMKDVNHYCPQCKGYIGKNTN